MGAKPTIIKQLVVDALNRFPKVATKSIARVLREESPEVFYSLEQARRNVRQYRGAIGKRCRKYAVATRTKEESEQCRTWGTSLPKPVRDDWEWQELPADVGRWLIIADLHIGYHDDKAIRNVAEYANGECDGIVLLGDVLDFYQISRFSKDPRKPGVIAEIEACKQVLGYLQHKIKPKRMIFREGNHDERFTLHVMKTNPEMAQLILEFMSIDGVLGLKENGVQFVNCMTAITHHELTLLHGDEYGSGITSPVNPARGAFLRTVDCTLSAHGHRRSNHVERSLRNRVVQNFTIGCMCQLHPRYARINKWDHSFAVLNAGSKWNIELHSVINGEVL